MKVVNARGDVLFDIVRGSEQTLLNSDEYKPLTHALVIASHKGKYLFMFNRARRNWEVPGGTIDDAEVARDCAAREFLEETGQDAPLLEFVGLMHFHKFPDGRSEFGALYSTELDGVGDLLPTEEAEELLLWDLETDIGDVDEIDRALCKILKGVAHETS